MSGSRRHGEAEAKRFRFREGDSLKLCNAMLLRMVVIHETDAGYCKNYTRRVHPPTEQAHRAGPKAR